MARLFGPGPSARRGALQAALAVVALCLYGLSRGDDLPLLKVGLVALLAAAAAGLSVAVERLAGITLPFLIEAVVVLTLIGYLTEVAVGLIDGMG